jgi:hypothetical protein
MCIRGAQILLQGCHSDLILYDGVSYWWYLRMEIALFQPSVTKNFEVAVTFLENFFIPFYTFCRRFVTYIQNVPV